MIADSQTTTFDSAVFISGTSFNIGQEVLGPDLTITDNTAICFGENYTINTGLDPLTYTFQWAKNGSGLATQTGPSLTINSPGTYSLTYIKNGSVCPPTTNSILTNIKRICWRTIGTSVNI